MAGLGYDPRLSGSGYGPPISRATSAGGGPPGSYGAPSGTGSSGNSRPLPRLHYCCWKGDLLGVLTCITDGHDVHETVSMKNQHNKAVCGITPLFLAAQRGHIKICKLLIENGANPNQPGYLHGSTELCTPAEVARLNLHFALARYLKKMIKHRKQEDAVLAEDEDGPIGGGAGSVAGSRMGSVSGAPQVVQPAGPETDAAAGRYMANLGDLTDWDPTTGKLESQEVKKVMKKLDLAAWRPDENPEKQSKRSFFGSFGMAVRKHRTSTDAAPPSRSTVVNPTEVDNPEEDNRKNLSRYLKDLDLVAWNPDQGGEQQQQQPGSARAGTSTAQGSRTNSLMRRRSQRPEDDEVVSASVPVAMPKDMY